MEDLKIRKPRKQSVRKPKIIGVNYISQLIQTSNLDAIDLIKIIEVCNSKMAVAKKLKIAELLKQKNDIENSLKMLQAE